MLHVASNQINSYQKLEFRTLTLSSKPTGTVKALSGKTRLAGAKICLLEVMTPAVRRSLN